MKERPSIRTISAGIGLICVSGLEAYAICAREVGLASQMSLPAWLHSLPLWIAVFLLLNGALLALHLWKHFSGKTLLGMLLFAGAVSAYQLVFYSFRITHHLTLLTASWRRGLSSLLTWAGLTCLLVLPLAAVNRLIDREAEASPRPASGARSDRASGARTLAARIEKHPFAFAFLGAFLTYLPFLYFLYPGSYGWDTLFQLQQWLGMIPYYTSTPLLTTILYGLLYDLGEFLFYTNQAGLFMIFLGQACAMAAAVGLVYSTARLCSMSTRFRRFAFLFLVLLPVFPSFVAFCNKDTPYLAAIMALACFSARLFLRPRGQEGTENEEKKNHAARFRDVLGFGISLFLTMTLRLNGPLAGWSAVIAVSALLLIRFLREKENRTRILRLAGGCLALPLVVYLMFTGWVTPQFSPFGGKPSARESILSLLFLQTARAVRDYPEAVTGEEQQVLSQIWDYGNLPTYASYDLVDPVRNNRIGWSQDYMKVWRSLGARVPQAYVDAALGMSGKYLYLFEPINRFTGYTMDDHTEGKLAGMNVILPEQYRRRSAFSGFMTEWVYLFPLRLLNNAAPYLWLAVYLTLRAIRRCGAAHWAVGAIVLSMTVSALLSPSAEIRYALPVIGCWPLELMAVSLTFQRRKATK